ncbi:SNARE complex subunit [Ascodesmis nigricans]|uniref:SNARE complex subunit n=1 Tax=Ascodesmis nigricans TaxID=341454 RepID=A0A4S2N775_9PEZI|nr:SNARE complex subunit [Ascodesmis nigricans]
MSLDISIPDTSEVKGSGKAYTAFHIHLALPMRNLTVKKRYSEFVDLHSSLTTHTGAPPPSSLPPKSYLTGTVGNPTRTENRRAGLESYLRAILTHPDSRWRDSPVWRTFLSLPASFTVSSPPPSSAGQRRQSTSIYSGLPTGPITDPSLWLDSHRDLKGHLHDARIWLGKRDQAATPQEAQEASTESKRSLVKASSLISALDAGLKDRGDNNNEPTLPPGEIRRRKDLIATARKERDALESLASAIASRANANLASTTTGTTSSSPQSQQKAALFNGRRNGVPGRRVLGGPAQETEQTRELDNTGVLQLQKQVMEDQEQGVMRLLGIVRKQKELGLAINEELEVQNEMLNNLEEDVDRVDKKTRIAKKRADKIR